MASLTRDEAISRAAAVRVDGYDIDLDLTTGDRVFRSRTTIRFTGTGAFLDVQPDELRALRLDGVDLDGTVADGRIALPPLPDGPHELVVVADMAYTNTGQGLHRFVDPIDGLTYLYGQLWLDDASRVFACFDQPDLKAPVTMRVTVDPQWTAVANGAGTEVSPGRWEFATTEPLATYFVTLVAGPYHRVAAEHDGIPMGLYARASLAGELNEQAPEIFGVMAACFDWYHAMFGVRYPWGKYDTAFVPEFTMGAMENPGCVTIRDSLVYTSAVTDADREARAGTISHEMAHMWFGDLVTMRWWDDLWLNESFAEYLGTRALADATEFTDAWTSFSIERKSWGYAADQRRSTHPVAPADVPDTAAALLNFDGISYAKGASVLRQLAVWLGDDAFFGGLRTHFARHAFANATLDDLLGALAEASGRDLSEWSRVWLRSAQVSTLRPIVALDAAGRYASVAIEQTSPTVLRPHRINVATGVLDADGRLRPRDVVPVEIDGARTEVTALTGTPAADLLLVNDGDLTYAKIRIDPTGIAGVLPAAADPLTRALIWGSVWDATRDAEVPPAVFLDLIAAGLPGESNVAILPKVQTQALDHVVDRFLPDDQRAAGRVRVAVAARAAFDAAPAGGGWQLAAVRGLIRSAGPGDAAELRGWLAGQRPNDLVVDAELRWLMLIRLAELGAIGPAEVEDEYARDRTAVAAEKAARCRAALPDPVAKATAWQRLIDDDAMSNKLLFATALGFWVAGQETITGSYVERYVRDVPAMGRRRAAIVGERIAQFAYPATAVTPATHAALTAMERAELTPGVRRALSDGNDEMARALAARARATN